MLFHLFADFPQTGLFRRVSLTIINLPIGWDEERNNNSAMSEGRAATALHVKVPKKTGAGSERAPSARQTLWLLFYSDVPRNFLPQVATVENCGCVDRC
jgi:hypothetical protein